MSESATRATTPVTNAVVPGARRRWFLLVGALVFLVSFFAVTVAGAALSRGPMPLPNASSAEQVRFLAANPSSSVVTGILQGLSACGLAVVVTGLLARSKRGAGPGRRGDRVWLASIGLLAVVSLLVSAATAVTLGVIAPGAGQGTVAMVRTVSFLTGGVVHVVALGLLVAFASRALTWSRPVAVFGVVAAVPAVLSLVSVLWFPASALLPLGRVLCMVWAVTAGVSVLRGRPAALG